MSRDNSTNFDSWNTRNYNRDTRHAPDGKGSQWDSEFSDLNEQFIQHQTLSHLSRMLESRDERVRELARQIISEKSGAAGALKSHNQATEESLKTQVAKPRGRRRSSWNSGEINQEVRNLWNQNQK